MIAESAVEPDYKYNDKTECAFDKVMLAAIGAGYEFVDSRVCREESGFCRCDLILRHCRNRDERYIFWSENTFIGLYTTEHAQCALNVCEQAMQWLSQFL